MDQFIDKICKIFGKNPSSITLRNIHNGYCAKSFSLKVENDEYFLKKFDKKKDMGVELFAISQLNGIVEDAIITPKIIVASDDFLVMEYIVGKDFYEYFCNKCDFMEINKILLHFGRYLSLFHNKTFSNFGSNGDPIGIIHGDLNSKNFKFLGEKMYVMDPRGDRGIIYDDLADFILNFYPVNIFMEKCFFGRKDEYIKSFLSGYAENLSFDINENRLNERIIDQLVANKKLHSNKPYYVCKKTIVNLYINYLIKMFKNGKIHIKLYK